MVPNEELHILTIHFEPLKRGQPLYKGRNGWSQGVLYNRGSTVSHWGYGSVLFYREVVPFLEGDLLEGALLEVPLYCII